MCTTAPLIVCPMRMCGAATGPQFGHCFGSRNASRSLVIRDDASVVRDSGFRQLGRSLTWPLDGFGGPAMITGWAPALYDAWELLFDNAHGLTAGGTHEAGSRRVGRHPARLLIGQPTASIALLVGIQDSNCRCEKDWAQGGRIHNERGLRYESVVSLLPARCLSCRL